MRNYVILALTITSIGLANNQGTCIQEESSHQEECCIQTYDHRLQIGPNFTYCWVSPEGNSSTDGPLGGAQALYEYRPFDFFYGAIAFNWRQGSTDNSVTKRNLIDVHAQERLGYTFALSCYSSRLTLFSGLGGRYMSEKVTTGSSSVTFNYAQFYVPVGFLADYEINSCFNWGLGFQWRPQFYPTVDIIPIDGARWKLRKKLDNFYAEMPLTIKLSDSFSWTLNPFFEYWNDGETLAATTLGLPLALPSNQYYFVGLDVNFVWDF